MQDQQELLIPWDCVRVDCLMLPSHVMIHHYNNLNDNTNNRKANYAHLWLLTS